MRLSLLAAALGLSAAMVGSPALARSTAASANTVQCADGTQSKSGRGACSHHGGVANASPAKAPATKAAPDPAQPRAQTTGKDAARRSTIPLSPPAAEAPARRAGRAAPAAPSAAPSQQTRRTPAAGQPTALCKDGTASYSAHRSGTCSRHGGVAQWY